MHRDALNVNLDTELLACFPGVAALTQSCELESVAVVGENAHIYHALLVPWVIKDDQELLGEVLEHLDVVVVDAELVAQGIAEVMGLGVVTTAVELAYRRPVDELISARTDVSGSCHRAVGPRGPGPWIPRVPGSRHVLFAAFRAVDHLRKGVVVDLG
jgi:hypothetical protein